MILNSQQKLLEPWSRVIGMSETFDMMALETVNNPYLGGDTSLIVSSETAAQIDEEVLSIIKTCHENAIQILDDNKPKLHEITQYLYDRETITGEEFMEILNKKEDETVNENPEVLI